jgi:Domain of unknown function (DUF4160)/Protein of unknown function (DUF2442)
MAPTIVRDGQFRLFFFSREETRIDVHVAHPDGEAKSWLTRAVHLATNIGLSSTQVRQAQAVVEAHLQEIENACRRHFGRGGHQRIETLLLGSLGKRRGVRSIVCRFPVVQKKATIEQLADVERPTENHLYWPQLDVDLSVESIRNPAAFPLVSKTAS